MQTIQLMAWTFAPGYPISTMPTFYFPVDDVHGAKSGVMAWTFAPGYPI